MIDPSKPATTQPTLPLGGLASLKTLGRRIREFMSIPLDHPELLKAQYRALAQQLPMMYLILMTSTWAVAVTHMPYAPGWLTIVIPSIMTMLSAVRITRWARSRHVEPTTDTAGKALRHTYRLSILIAAGFVGWSLMLYPYGDAYTKSHLAFYMAITVISCIFCLMHLRPAAIMVTAIVDTAFVGFFAMTGQPTLIATAINIALVSIGMLMILMINYRDFTRMIDAQLRTQALSNENLRLANLDSLTDLPNRRAFFAHLAKAFDTARSGGGRLAVGMLDLDGFKPVNDLYGHAAGDKLLIEVGQRLAVLCAPMSIHLSRLGGDEFALVVSNFAPDLDLVAFGEQICTALRAPFHLPEATMQISGSAGFAVYPTTASSPEELFDRADYALYHGKRTARGAAILFSADHIAEIHRDARIEQGLKVAGFEAELDVVFQPIVDIRTEATIGFEALARWTSATLGQVPPSLFIPVAERAGIIGRLTQPLLRKALAAAGRWPVEMRLSFNLSAYDLSTQEGVLSVVSTIEKSGFDPRRVDLEITETAFMHDFAEVQHSVALLRTLGCGISLDDFGTGYSSLSRLHALPLTKIKVDRSFVTNLHEKPASYKIVKSLLALSHDMSVDCIIEGVETREEMDALMKLEGFLVQGYYYSRPISEQDIPGFLGRKIFVAKAS
jgi:diguanylate cyclase (GGDEF)-like protein